MDGLGKLATSSNQVEAGRLVEVEEMAASKLARTKDDNSGSGGVMRASKSMNTRALFSSP
jgi:hypothetical protein